MEPLTREETLEVLSSMGVDLPKTTKLSADVLDKRLCDALNHAQNRINLPASLDPMATAPQWPWPSGTDADAHENPLFKALGRGTLAEGDRNLAAQRAGVTLERTTLYKDPFEDLRETFLAIGKVLDIGRRWLVVQDPKAQEYGVLMRFLTILHVDGAGTPGIILLYRAVTARDGPDGAEWASYTWKRDNGRMGQPGLGASTVFASPLEVKLLLKLLEINAKMLVPEYQPPKERFEGRFKTSVLFPIAPLSFKALGHLNYDPGCAVCGKKQAKRCTQCQSISYCGTDCQKIDWREHKIKCRSLKDGRWVTVSFRMKFPGDEQRPYMTLSQRTTNSPQDVQAFINNSMNLLRPVDHDVVNIPPPNVHGERTFLIKIQTPMNPRYPAFLIYDRQKSFQSVFFCQQDNPELYREFLVETRGPRGRYDGNKMYRWARRTGEFELSVCLDRAPEIGTMDADRFFSW